MSVPLRVGISLTSAHAIADPRQGARVMVERAAAARGAGLDSLFLGDHHSTGAPYYQNVPMLGRLLAEWGDASAGCLFLLPLWHPVLLAEQVGALAALAQGRFILQCGLGDGVEQFDAMGYTDVIVRHLTDDQPKVLASMSRLAAVRQALR
jgi:alkanesulfonate monooxygenase SsuD/methylene tetrahydromethanopterin reductase-like flavin-dependent oxidoreductase (luciferase family)